MPRDFPHGTMLDGKREDTKDLSFFSLQEPRTNVAGLLFALVGPISGCRRAGVLTRRALALEAMRCGYALSETADRGSSLTLVFSILSITVTASSHYSVAQI